VATGDADGKGQMTSEQLVVIYERLMQKDFYYLDVDKEIEAVGRLIDVSCDLSMKEGLDRAIGELELLLTRDVTASQRSVAHYFVGNAWSHLRVLKHADPQTIWEWEQVEIEKEILNFRCFNNFFRQSDRNRGRFCQANTNMANTLNHIGRFVEAIESWDRALRAYSSFGMALANKGLGLISYMQSLYDDGHAKIFLRFAYELLRRGLKDKAIHEATRRGFEQTFKQIESWGSKEFFEGKLELDDYELGDHESERLYRKWCLEHRLFLNPLNDLGAYNIAARDILTCPSLYVPVEESSGVPPSYFSFYNQIKQEYVAARYIFYESLQADGAHFSDKGVLLYNTLEYPCYGLNTEKAKVGFRVAYSLFDKIAYFLNEYLKLDVKDRRISFRTLWYKDQKKSKGLHERFAKLQNWPMRGLFWLAKDFSERRSEFSDAMEPEANDIAAIRNSLEHKYLTITEYDMSDVEGMGDGLERGITRISRDDFIQKTFKLFHLGRAALIYLSLATHAEERKKRKVIEGKIVPPMFLDTWDDEWKT